MFGLGIWELVVILLIVLVVFGAKRLPEIGASLGEGIREFKDSLSGVGEEVNRELPGGEEAPREEETGTGGDQGRS